MGLDTNYQYDGGDAPGMNSDMAASDGPSPEAQAAMSEGLDDVDAAGAPPDSGTPPAAPADQPGDWQNVQPHIGGLIEADINKEAEGRPVWMPKGETEGASPEPPEGYHPGGVEGGW